MGNNCCGKGSAVKDPDRAPYSPTNKDAQQPSPSPARSPSPEGVPAAAEGVSAAGGGEGGDRSATPEPAQQAEAIQTGPNDEICLSPQAITPSKPVTAANAETTSLPYQTTPCYTPDKVKSSPVIVNTSPQGSPPVSADDVKLRMGEVEISGSPHEPTGEKRAISYTEQKEDGSVEQVTIQTKTLAMENNLETLVEVKDSPGKKELTKAIPEPLDTDSIMANIRAKAKEAGVLVSSQTKTTLVTKTSMSPEKEEVTIQTRETKSRFTSSSPEDQVVKESTVTTAMSSPGVNIHKAAGPTGKMLPSPTSSTSSPNTDEMALFSALKLLQETTEDLPNGSKTETGTASSIDEAISSITNESMVEVSHTQSTPTPARVAASSINHTTPVSQVNSSPKVKPADDVEPLSNREPDVELHIEEDEAKDTKLDCNKNSNAINGESNDPPTMPEPFVPVSTTTKEKNEVSPSKIPTTGIPMRSPIRMTATTKPPTSPLPIEAKIMLTKPSDSHHGHVNGSCNSTSIPNIPVHKVSDDLQNIEEFIKEPLVQINLKNAVKSALVDFSGYNYNIRTSHPFCFNSRARLMQHINRWFEGHEKDRDEFSQVMGLVGGPGTGKTTIAAELCRKYSAQLAGHHFFQYNNGNLDHNDPRRVLQSLAHAMCDAFPNYANMLHRSETLDDVLQNGSLIEMFDVLFQQPLNSPGLHHDPEKHALVVVDGLDECEYEHQEILLRLISNINDNLPDWMYLVITINNDNQLLAQLENVQINELKNNNDTFLDIKRYLKDPLSRFMDRLSLDGGLSQLAKRADGNMLCARVLKGLLDNMPEDKNIALREVEGMFPKGLSGVYNSVFGDFKKQLLATTSPKQSHLLYTEILGVLACAREPLPVDVLTSWLAVDRAMLSKCLSPVLLIDSETISFCHHNVAYWLQNPQEAGDLVVNNSTAKSKMAEFCVKWLGPMISENVCEQNITKDLKKYALKHIMWHLTNVPKQQDQVASILCNLVFVKEKLQLENVLLKHLFKDYKHSHYYIGGNEAPKHVTLSEYMKKYPKLLDQMGGYYKFVQDKGTELITNPQFTLHIAANYPTFDRLQQNARVELADRPWIESLTTLPETQCVAKSLGGQILGIDLSRDGKTAAVVTKDEDYNLRLYLVNIATAEKKTDAIDIKMWKDRVGLCARFLMDNTSIFIGSLSTFVSLTGKPQASGIEMGSVQLKDKYSIECCDVSGRYLACGLSTFPWGGRSLHLALVDLRAKKCIKTLEVLKFRFGGSAQFGIKSVSISSDETMICTCVKQSNKAQLRATVWSIPKMETLHSVDLDDDNIRKCIFVGDSSLLFGGCSQHMGVHDGSMSQDSQTLLWSYKQSADVKVWHDKEHHSTFSRYKGGTLATRWSMPTNSASVQVWNKGLDVQGQSSVKYNLVGIQDVTDMIAAGDHLVYVCHSELRIYSLRDFEIVEIAEDESKSRSVQNLVTKDTCFIPKTDDLLLKHLDVAERKSNIVTVSTLSASADELEISPSPINKVFTYEVKLERTCHVQCFVGAGATGETVSAAGDGSLVVLKSGCAVHVWNRSTNKTYTLPGSEDLGEAECETNALASVVCAVSPKDPLAAVVYNPFPCRVFVIDLKTRKVLHKIEAGSGTRTIINDVTFLPSNGHLVVYSRNPHPRLAVYNLRNGQQTCVVEGVCVSYARPSPSSDRLALSIRREKKAGELLLMNSDRRFSNILDVPSVWLPSTDDSDLEFSPDGTTLIGVAMETSICRVWNAGNGEILNDIDVSFTGVSEIVGMVTNTHVVFHDDRLVVVDIVTGQVVSMLPLDHDVLCSRSEGKAMKISSKSGFISSVDALGQLNLFRCNNITSAKRKTTLQLLKSITK